MLSKWEKKWIASDYVNLKGLDLFVASRLHLCQTTNSYSVSADVQYNTNRIFSFESKTAFEVSADTQWGRSVSNTHL